MSRTRRWLRRLAFAVLALGVVYAGLRLGLGAYANARLEAELELVRAAGEPLAFEDVAPSRIDKAENGASVILTAEELPVDKPGVVYDAMESLQGDPLGISAAHAAALESWVAANRPALDVLNQALEKPIWRFVADWSSAVGMDFEGVWEVVSLRDVLEVRGLLEIRAGESEAALRTAEQLLDIAARMGEEPLLILELVRQTVQGSAFRILAWVLRVEGLPRATLARIQHSLEATDNLRSARDCILAERAYASTVFYESLQTDAGFHAVLGDGALPWHRALLFRLFREPMIRLDHARWLELSRRALALAEGSWVDTEDAWAREVEAVNEAGPWYELASAFALQSASFVPKQVAKHGNRARALDLALAIEMYEREHGALPETPGVLGLIPTDPLTGEPFGYERTHEGRGYRILGAHLPDREDENFSRPPRE